MEIEIEPHWLLHGICNRHQTPDESLLGKIRSGLSASKVRVSSSATDFLWNLTRLAWLFFFFFFFCKENHRRDANKGQKRRKNPENELDKSRGDSAYYSIYSMFVLQRIWNTFTFYFYLFI